MNPNSFRGTFRSRFSLQLVRRSVAALTLGLTVDALAATKYVSPSGSNGNSGNSPSAPYQTIAYALTQIAGGDTLNLMAGTFVENIENTIPSGSAGAPTVIQTYSTDTVTIRHDSVNDIPGNGIDIIRIAGGKSYITIRGSSPHKLILDGNLTADKCIRLSDSAASGATNIVIENAELHRTKTAIADGGSQNGIVFYFGGDSNVMRNCKVHDHGGDTQDHGLYILGDGNTVENCEIYNNTGHGIHSFSNHVEGKPDNNIYRNNRVHDNASVGIGLYSGTNNVAYNNLCWDNGASGIRIGLGASNAKLYNNTAWSNTSPGGTRKGIHVDSGTGHVLSNNLSYANTTGDFQADVAVTLNTNLWDGTNPQFISTTPTHVDFLKIPSGSPAVNAGTTVAVVTTDYWGEARPQGGIYDIGADEFMSSVPAAPSGLTATAISYNQINLAWTDNAGNESGFKIERKKGASGTYVQIATVGANATSYNDTAAGAFRQYYYRVRAYNGNGDSGYSNEANATTSEITSGRQAHWKLNETSGTTTADASGNGNTGTLSNGPMWTPGLVDGGLSFDGVDDIVNCLSGTTLDNLVAQGGGGMTVSAMIKATTMGEGGFGRIVFKGTGSAPVAGWHFITGGTNQLTFAVDHATTDLVRQTATNSIGTGAWYHVLVTWNGSTTATNAKIYVNGTEVGSYTVSTNASGARVSDAAANLYLGNEIGGTRTFNGVLDEVRVFNRVISASEITAIYVASMVSY